MSLKQNTYPVLFLTEGGQSIWNCEPCCNSLQQALYFCKEANLDGIVSNANSILNSPNIVQDILNDKLAILSYGNDNNVFENVRTQIQMGVNGIITDCLKQMKPLFLKQ